MQKELRQESAPVRGRVHFQLKDISQFERPPGGFDTIILGRFWNILRIPTPCWLMLTAC